MEQEESYFEFLIIVEGVKNGIPFRESRKTTSLTDLHREMVKYTKRIQTAPTRWEAGAVEPVIISVVFKARKVSPWSGYSQIGSTFVDAWLESSREPVWSKEEIQCLRERHRVER